MEGTSSYPLLVKLEKNNLPRVKIKLIKYFQSKKSNGGDCEVDYENGSWTAVLRFRKEEDQKNVLAKDSHQIRWDNGVLKMTVCLLTDDTTGQDTPSKKLTDKCGGAPLHVGHWPKGHADVAVKNSQSSADAHTPAATVQAEAEGGHDKMTAEELCSTSAVLGNIPEKLSQEFLEMLVENILRDLDAPSASHAHTLEVIPVIASAVVTFQSEKECTEFVKRCPQNRTFTKKGLSVQRLEVTQQVIVEDLQHFNEDFLRLYFENAGGEVETVVFNDVEQSAILTFKDHKVVQKIMKKKHLINKEEVQVFPFYSSLGTALYGKDKPSLNPPAAISEPIEKAVWTYLKSNQLAAETIHSDLAKHFCNVDLSQSNVCLRPAASLLQQKNAKVIIREWKDTVKSAFAQSLSVFKSLKLQPESQVWEESERMIRQMLQKEDVVIVPDKASGVLTVAGFVDVINRHEKTLREAVNKLVKRVQREKLRITKEIMLSQSVFHILCQDGLRDKLLSVYPELEMSYRTDSPKLTVTGLGDEIIAAQTVIYDKMITLIRQNVEIDPFVLSLLKDEQQEELTNVVFKSNGINAAFEINNDKVQLLAVNDKELKDAEDHLGRLLISKYIDVDDSNVLKKPEWKHLVSQLENANNMPCSRIRIYTSGQQIVVSGHKDGVERVSSELDDFITQNALVEETIVIRPNVIVEYIKKLDTSWMEKVDEKVAVSFKKEAICLSGCRVDVLKCKTLAENKVSSVFFESLKIPMPGAKKFFKSQGDMYASALLNETGCVVQLVDEIGWGPGDSSQVSKPVYQFQTEDGVEIAICKADMCCYPVHAVVSSATQNLKPYSRLARALLNAAGPQLQAECDKIITLNGQLRPGDCVITAAGGKLYCKKVIHAMVPTFDMDKIQNSQNILVQLKATVKESLELAEKHGCVSVALPNIGRSAGFPLKLCVVTIVKAVKEYCDENGDDSPLKRIHFVDVNDSTVQALEAAVRKEFGNHDQQTLPNQSSPVKSGSNPNCLGQVQTKEGLDITLEKGNIEHAMTEVTVNTVFEDLVLKKGAVSSAIFGVAGPKLQELVNAEKASGNVGDIIVTEGCKLKSSFVFHAVAPHWDKGQGTSQKNLRGIFKDCLNKAEDSGRTSMSFPAIGTGNLGFPKDLVASSMLDEMLAFSSQKQPKHLKRVVIILYPGDTLTIQAFSDEFKKKFPNTPGEAVPTRSGPFSKVVSSSGMHETKMGSVAIQAVTGDITKETTDVIVNSSNEKFSLKSGVSKAILEAAGQTVEDECHKLGAQPNAGMIMTQPGNLKCKKIIHIVGKNDPVKITKDVKDALQMCVTNHYTSISFPAIGTGQGNVQAKQVADAMLDAVIDVLSQNSSTTLKTIRIIIFQPPMLKDFFNSMEQREATHLKAKSLLGSLASKIKELITRRSDEPQKEEDFVSDSLKVDPTLFHICGESQAKVDSAKQKINDLISKEHTKHCISEKNILSFSKADHQRIVDIQKTMSVGIQTQVKHGQLSFTIEGLSKDVLNASNEIHEMLKKARDEEDMRKKMEAVSKVVVWQYLRQGFQFQDFDSKTNYELEQAREKNLPSVKVTIQGQQYTVQMPKGPATDSQGQSLEIKRIDLLKEMPENWETMPTNTSCQAIPIKAGTAEYTDVQNVFRATCGLNIVKIERIQNPVLWKSLQIKKHDMERRNGHQNNEKRLFHGTDHNTVPTINKHGFNRSYAGKNAACYGNGTYFAVKATYSAQDTYSRPNQNGEKCMYLCRVLTGDYTLGKRDMIVPPAKGSNSNDLYDSVVDNMANPTMFVIFHDDHAYPEYLITFK